MGRKSLIFAFFYEFARFHLISSLPKPARKRPWNIPRPVRLNKKRELYTFIKVQKKAKFTFSGQILTYVTKIVIQKTQNSLNCGII